MKTAVNSRRGPVSRGLRFDVFRRDRFICRYCGGRPPDVVLELDHVVPVADGGRSEEENLVTSCWDCNRGKGRKPLNGPTPRAADADLDFLAVQQELAEAQRYARAITERERATALLVEALRGVWKAESGSDGWLPPPASIRQMLKRHPPERIETALRITAGRVSTGSVDGHEWQRFAWGCLKKLAEKEGGVCVLPAVS